MYECPNCGGNLKFDILSQQLACAFCDTHISPYGIKKDTDAIEREYFEATVFTCPQCGGEILSADNEAAAFCSFCGASTILSGRISKEKRPRYIIPFKITKEGCKAAYENKMKKAFFAPKELRDPKYIDSFRGIYMPYWTYQLLQKGEVTFDGTKSHREGDYIITEHFDLHGDLDAYYLGYSRDASSTFYDNISEPLAPYDAKQLVNFEPTFLSGFYADTADVDSGVYLDEVTELAKENTLKQVRKEPAFKGLSIDSSEGKKEPLKQIPSVCKEADSTMYPVWFLSYRNKDRVAYATVNGQTGKVVVDLPVDIKRYVWSSLILAVPVFILLNMFFTFRPVILLGISCIMAVLSAWIYNSELKAIQKKEANTDDEGIQNVKRKMLMKSREAAGKAGGVLTQAKSSKSKKKKKAAGALPGPVVVIMLALWLIPILAAADGVLVWPIVVIGTIVVCTMGINSSKKTNGKPAPGYILSIAAVVIAGVIAFFRPVSDLWYYGSVMLVLVSVLFNVISMITSYNRLAMRKLPQFYKKGGDDRA